MEDELRRRAAAHGHSVQEKASNISLGALGAATPQGEMNLYTYIRSLVEPIGGVDDLVVPVRDIGREPPNFD